MSGNSDSSNSNFQFEYINLSSNRLTKLDFASVKWLNQTTAVTDLTANPWKFDCSMFLEVFRGLKHKLILQCASPEQFQGKSWELIEEILSEVLEDVNKKSNTSSESIILSTESNEESGVSTLEGCPSVVTTSLIVTGVVLVCAICGGLILVMVVKRLRNKPKTPEHSDVYAPRVSNASLHSYAEVGARTSNVTVESYADVGERPPYITVLS